MTEHQTFTSRGVARHQALIDAAADLFLAKGFAAVTVDEIVAAAGGSKTNVYRQFGGKEGLFAEVVERLSTEFLSPLTQMDLGTAEHATGLDILGRTLLRQLLQPRHIAFQRMVLATSGQFPELMAKWYQCGPRRSQAIIAGFLGPGEDNAQLAVFFHDMIVTDIVNNAMMGQIASWPEIETTLGRAVALITDTITLRDRSEKTPT